MSTALYAGSFDPVTLGHIDIMRRAAAQFDRLVVCVLRNPKKRGLFTPEERVELIRRSLAEVDGVENIEVNCADGLAVDYARACGAGCIVKGLRRISDFESEMQLADINRALNPAVDTLFLTAKPELSFVSSTNVKELVLYHAPLCGYVADSIAEDIKKRFFDANSALSV